MDRPILELLTTDHERIRSLLASARDGDRDAYAELRPTLLRHIGLEEKILLPALRACTELVSSVAEQLRLDHAAIVAMLVPPPSPEVLARLAAMLDLHDPLEEAEGGVYERADALPFAAGVLERLKLAPAPPVAQHFAGPRAYSAIDELAARAMAGRRPR